MRLLKMLFMKQACLSNVIFCYEPRKLDLKGVILYVNQIN